MARRYGRKAGRKVKRAMHEMKRGKLKSGRSGRRVKSRKQAIAIGLSEARRSGAKVPSRKTRQETQIQEKEIMRKPRERPDGAAGRRHRIRQAQKDVTARGQQDTEARGIPSNVPPAPRRASRLR